MSYTTNNRASLDIYYQDPSNTQYVVKDENDNCGGLCNYDNVGLKRPSYTRVPTAKSSNVFNKYIWRETSNNSQMYLSVSGKSINGYVKFNDNSNYPIEGKIEKENKKASILIKYPKSGIMDQGTIVITKNGKDKYKLVMKLSSHSKMTFINNQLKSNTFSRDGGIENNEGIENNIEYDNCFFGKSGLEKEPLYLSTSVDNHDMFLAFDKGFVKDTQVFISNNKPKHAELTGLNIKTCKKPKNCKYSVDRNIPNIWMIAEYNQPCQFLIYSYSEDTSNVPNYFIGCGSDGGVNVSSSGGSEEQVWEFEKNGDQIYIKSVYYGWYLGTSTEPSILKNTNVIKMSNTPCNWKFTKAHITPYNPVFKHSSKLDGFYTYKYTTSDEYNIKTLLELKMKKNKGLISIPHINKDGEKIVMDVKFKKTNLIVGENDKYTLTINVIKIKGNHVVLNIKAADKHTKDVINLSGNPHKYVNNYSLKIPELIPDIVEHLETDTSTMPIACPPKYPYAFGSDKWGEGNDCCIGNPGLDPQGKFDCVKYGCYGRGCGGFTYSKQGGGTLKGNAKYKNNSIITANPETQTQSCPKNYPYPYSGNISINTNGNKETYGYLEGINNNKNFFCCSDMIGQDNTQCLNSNSIPCPNPPCEPFLEDATISTKELHNLVAVQPISHISYDSANTNWKIYTQANITTGINISGLNDGSNTNSDNVINGFIDTARDVQKALSIGFSLVKLSSNSNKDLTPSEQTITEAHTTNSKLDLVLRTDLNPGGIIFKDYFKGSKNQLFPIDKYNTLYIYPYNDTYDPTCPSWNQSIETDTTTNCYVAPESRKGVPLKYNNKPIKQTDDNKETIKKICISMNKCYDDSVVGKMPDGKKEIPWCFEPGKMCSQDSDCGGDEGEECYIDPVCSAWNNAPYSGRDSFLTNKDSNFTITKNCNAIWNSQQGPNSSFKNYINRPSAGTNPDAEYKTDDEAYTDYQSNPSKLTVMGKCYNYGRQYTGSNLIHNNPENPCWGGTDTGNVYFIEDTSMNKGMCIKKNFIYMLINNKAYRYNTTSNLEYELPEPLPNSNQYSFNYLTEHIIKSSDGKKLPTTVLYGVTTTNKIVHYVNSTKTWNELTNIVMPNVDMTTISKIYTYGIYLYVLWSNDSKSGLINNELWYYDMTNTSDTSKKAFSSSNTTDFIVNDIQNETNPVGFIIRQGQLVSFNSYGPDNKSLNTSPVVSLFIIPNKPGVYWTDTAGKLNYYNGKKSSSISGGDPMNSAVSTVDGQKLFYIKHEHAETTQTPNNLLCSASFKTSTSLNSQTIISRLYGNTGLPGTPVPVYIQSMSV
jgi:hypothetical protein